MVSPKRVFNFSAGPCCLPLEILEQAKEDLISYKGCGMSVMEMSHRNKEFSEIWNNASNGIRKFLNIPESHLIFFFQGGASLQFSAIPMNFCGQKKKMNYLTAGNWSEKAREDAQSLGEVVEAFPNSKPPFTAIPDPKEWVIEKEAAYFHYCSNETIGGLTQFDFPYEAIPAGVPIISDMSSEFCSRPVDVSKYGLIYAGAQKNAGPAGNTVVIVRKDLIKKENIMKITPAMINYQKILEAPLYMYNTPCCWAIYMSMLYFDYLNKKGIKFIEDMAILKSKMFYDFVDNSQGYYKNIIHPRFRSRMNIPFLVKGGDAASKKFVEEARKYDLLELSGHRSVGGCRASIYNAMPVEGVANLLIFMKKFMQENP